MQLARRALSIVFAFFVLVGLTRVVAARQPDAPANADAGEPQAAPDSGADAAPVAPASPPPSEKSNLTVRADTEVAGYIDSTATSVLTPSVGASIENPAAGWSLSGHYLLDVVSAASPDIVSTASPNFKEVRNAGNIGGRYKPGLYGIAGNVGTSYTNDYLSVNAGVQLTQELDDKNLSLVEGYSYGHDTIGRTDTPFSVFHRTLQYHAFSVGGSRIVNSGLVLGLFGDMVFERGDQSKPYRYIPIFSPESAPLVSAGANASDVQSLRIQARPLEQLPTERNRYALTGRLAWRGSATTLRLEERGYIDTWGMAASTTDARLFIDVSNRVTVWPHARVNIQNGANFWRRTYVANDVHDLPAIRTGDRELGPLKTLGGGGGMRWALGKAGDQDSFVLTATFDGYWTDFIDALYVSDRFSALGALGAEVTF